MGEIKKIINYLSLRGRSPWQSRENRNTHGITSLRFVMTVTKELFYILLTALIIFIAMELIRPNIVQAYINLNILLILWLMAGIVLLVNKK
ncbi:MAG: hypothetical protein ABIH48_02490 [Candidatus Falkowbacteria bacterium]